MRVRSVAWYYVLTVLLVGLAVAICLDIFESDTVGELMPFIVSIVSLIIAVLAFDISMKTYSSIDAVNSISKMDGNIMENEDYRTNIIAILKQCTSSDKKTTRDEIMKKLNSFFSNDVVVSGAKLADSIQKLIDYIVILPYFVNSSNADYAKESKAKVETLIAVIEKEVKLYDKMSEGSSVLLEENLKLIKAVFVVQLKRTESVLHSEVNLMEVRGTMLKNPVSKTLFYDYSGLFYLVKALDHLASILGSKDHRVLYCIDNIRKIRVKVSDASKDIVMSYLSHAENEFNQALEVIDGDLMWSSMIYFNMARVKFFKSLFAAKEETSDWLSFMNRAISYRNRFNLFLSDVFVDKTDAYLVRAFADEERYARMQKIVFEMALEDDVTDLNGNVLVNKSDYSDVMNVAVVKEFSDRRSDDFCLLQPSYNEIVKYSQKS